MRGPSDEVARTPGRILRSQHGPSTVYHHLSCVTKSNAYPLGETAGWNQRRAEISRSFLKGLDAGDNDSDLPGDHRKAVEGEPVSRKSAPRCTTDSTRPIVDSRRFDDGPATLM